MRSALVRNVFVMFCFLALCQVSVAQAPKGTIAGHVTDVTGAVLQGARVRLPVAAVSTVSDEQGNFTIIGLAPGSYDLTISFVGFSDFSGNVTVSAGQVARLNAVLRVASKSEEIVVTGAEPHGVADAINRQRTAYDIIDVIPSEVIRSLPNANVADAAARLPGVTLERDEGEGKYVQIRGTEPRLTNVTVDGVTVPARQAYSHCASLGSARSRPGTSRLIRSMNRPQSSQPRASPGGAFGFLTVARERLSGVV